MRCRLERKEKGRKGRKENERDDGQQQNAQRNALHTTAVHPFHATGTSAQVQNQAEPNTARPIDLPQQHLLKNKYQSNCWRCKRLSEEKMRRRRRGGKEFMTCFWWASYLRCSSLLTTSFLYSSSSFLLNDNVRQQINGPCGERSRMISKTRETFPTSLFCFFHLSCWFDKSLAYVPYMQL